MEIALAASVYWNIYYLDTMYQICSEYNHDDKIVPKYVWSVGYGTIDH